MAYFYLKALHIVFIVTWFAGLFYLVRIFIYHIEAREKNEEEREILTRQYKIMARRLLHIIAWPSAVLTLILGITLFIVQRYYLNLAGWMHLKFTLLVLLYIYHFYCHSIYKKLRNNLGVYSTRYLRILNEIATILLFTIVIIAVLKSAVDIQRELIWISGLILFLYGGIRLYSRLRGKYGDENV
ncbi:CopD family protein [Bacteroidota bacterium]